MLIVYNVGGIWWKWNFFIKTLQFLSEKCIRQIPEKGFPVEYLTNGLTTGKVIKTKASPRKCHGPEEPKKTWWLNVICCLGMGNDLRLIIIL